MSNYPDAEDAFTPVTGSDVMSEHAERHTAEEEAIVAIQKTLGTNPEGTNTTVVERLDAFDAHTHDDLAAVDHTHDDLAAVDHTHDSDDTKLDKGTTTYLDAKAIEDDISGIEQSISDLSNNYDQIVIDLGEAGKDLTVELESYLKKGTASYADAKGIEDDIDQEKTDRAEGDKTLQEAIEAIVVPDVSDFVTGDELTTALSGKADEPHTHDTTHDHEEYFLSGAEVDEFGQPIPLPYANAKLLGDEVDTKADEDHTHEGFAADDHTHDAPEINTSQVTLAADSVAGFHELEDGTEVLTQADVNIYLSENVVFKGTTWGDLAGRS